MRHFEECLGSMSTDSPEDLRPLESKAGSKHREVRLSVYSFDLTGVSLLNSLGSNVAGADVASAAESPRNESSQIARVSC